jgi:RsiW-degrading membrane proteinase PrsW (M82 family)
MIEILYVVFGLAPVLLFAVALLFLDTFKLVRPRVLVESLAHGVVAALVCLFIARLLLRGGFVALLTYNRYLAAVIEELLKAVFILAAVRFDRVGFMVDAAIVGFASGAGFAAAENLYYLASLGAPGLGVWVVRGFGTAIMHGATTAIVGIVAKALASSRQMTAVTAALPGLGLAIAVHMGFNQFTLSPFTAALVVVVVFPLLILLVFSRSEQLLRGWLDVGFSSDVELLQLLHSGELSESKIGTYLRSLKDRFPGEVLADMLCYLLIVVELSIKAKGVLLMREAGINPPVQPETRERLDELRHLENNIGPTGKLALSPFLHLTSRELWQIHMLQAGR